jgi:hypothetical protein
MTDKMFADIRTNDPDLIARAVREYIDAGKSVRITLDKTEDTHRFFVSESGPEPEVD